VVEIIVTGKIGETFMAIAPSKLGEFVMDEGFSWPIRKTDPPVDYTMSNLTVVCRLREKELVRDDVSDAQLIRTFEAAREEHIEGDYSCYNSPQERVRVFLEPYLTDKGRRWAKPLESLRLPDE
jgi:hypothetical protein